MDGECIFENADNFMLDCYPTKTKLAKAFTKSACMHEEVFNNDYFLSGELDHSFDQILQEYYDESTRTSKLNETMVYSAMDRTASGFLMSKKSQLNLREVSSQLLKKLQEKRVNLVLVATSLDESDVVEKLKGSLDPETSSMIPLSFDEKNNVIDHSEHLISGIKLPSPKRKRDSNDGTNAKGSDQSPKLCSKKPTVLQKDKKYWKRRNSNNEAARRSREAKKARFGWIQNRTKELEVQNAVLQIELTNLEQKVLQIEEKTKKACEQL